MEHQNKNWEIEFDEVIGDIGYRSMKGENVDTELVLKRFIRNLLQSRDNALVAEIEELKEQRNEIYKMTVDHFSNEQEKVSFFKKFVDIIRIIQEK